MVNYYACIFHSIIYSYPLQIVVLSLLPNTSHKSFVKAPGLKTQRRVSEFAAQIAGQYYNMMVTRKACNYVDIGLASDRANEDHFRHRDNNNDDNNDDKQFSVEGRYIVDLFADGTIRLTATKNKSLKKHGLSAVLIGVLQRLCQDDYVGNTSTVVEVQRFEGYTRATVEGEDGEVVAYNAHPYFHGGPWYDWAYLYYEIEGEFGSREEYYPLKILGFIKDNDNEVHAVIQRAVKAVAWEELEEQFIIKFRLCSDAGEEQVVPLSALNNPICVIQDYGSNNGEDYLLILPKG